MNSCLSHSFLLFFHVYSFVVMVEAHGQPHTGHAVLHQLRDSIASLHSIVPLPIDTMSYTPSCMPCIRQRLAIKPFQQHLYSN